MNVRAYAPEDVAQMANIWNQVVSDGVAFPQTEPLDLDQARAFFAAQDFCGVCQDGDEVVGLYILHPNNVGRCGHIANASYAVERDRRGAGAGRALVCHSLETAKKLGFRLMQFNAVVRTNERALRLYESLGFVRLGIIPGGFLIREGYDEDIVLFYRVL